ncbi:tyrosine-type recombinase/integrase [Flavobacterium sp.]|uniref:tyrosine-type recombinase/integrase n=1 Tax=Flavobacterium sp. TaxID=239 RepID=UPI00286D81FA|nr:tyrosine-type recombinase/integrase [Flavobacterium sp.]
MRNIKDYLLEQYNIDYNTEQFINDGWLKDKILKFSGRVNKSEPHKIYFTDWIQKYLDNPEAIFYKGKPISPKTVQHYNTAKLKFTNYEKHTKTKLRFQDINLSFYHNFLAYCRDVQKINNNTIGTQISILKKWCRLIESEGLPINQEYKSSEFMVLTNTTKDIYLSENEINIVYNHNFSYSERLNNARYNFIIGLRTGLRISDFLKLEQLNLVDGYFEVETTKTSKSVVIPIHKQVIEILAKRNGLFPPKITDQKFNEYIKEICKEVDFTEMIEGAKMISKAKDKDFFPEKELLSKNKNRKQYGVYPKHELVTSHICRRSFVTNLYGQNLTNMNIMAVTGHTTETNFLKYIKTTPKENAEKIKEHWENKNL